MKTPAAIIGIIVCIFSTNAFGWAGSVCNYSSQEATVTFDVAASPSFKLVVPKESNSTAYDVAGLCMTSVSAVVSTDPPRKVIFETFAPVGNCTNSTVSLFDIPKTGQIAGLVFRAGGNTPCLQD